MSIEVNSIFFLVSCSILYLIFGGIFFNKFYNKILNWNLVSKTAPVELLDNFKHSEHEENKLFLSFFYYLFLWPVELFNFTPENKKVKIDPEMFDLYWNRRKLDRKSFIGMLLLFVMVISVSAYFLYVPINNNIKNKEAKILALGDDWASFYKSMDMQDCSKSEQIVYTCDFSKYRDLNPEEMSFVLSTVPDTWFCSCQKKFISKYQESRK